MLPDKSDMDHIEQLNQTIGRLEKRLDRERAKREHLERFSEEKTNELYREKQKLQLIGEIIRKTAGRNDFSAVCHDAAILLTDYSVCDGITVVSIDGHETHCLLAHYDDCLPNKLTFEPDTFSQFIIRGEKNAQSESVTHDDGVDIFHRVRALRDNPWCFIVFSFISKQKILNLDQEVIDHVIAQIRAVEQQERDAALIHNMSYFDQLTQLHAKEAFLSNFSKRLSIAANNQEFSLVVMDVAGMGIINSEHNMNVGDQLLKNIANELTKVLRQQDAVSRNGGNQFSFFIVAEQAETIVLNVIERINQHFKQPVLCNGADVSVRFHFGYVISSVAEMSAEQSLQYAQIAVKQAKGKAEYKPVLFEHRMLENVFDRYKLEESLHQALENDEFILHYQPIVELSNKRIVSVEALIRWRRTENPDQLVSPLEFIPILEQTNLIIPVGRWLVKQALQDFAAWRENCPELQQISINVSAKQFYDFSFHQYVEKTLESFGLASSCLNIEITESMYLESNNTVESFFKQLTDLGVDIALDDFGTGYSSLSYLYRYPINKLKIDRSFVKNLAFGNRNLRLLQSIIALSQSLDMRSVAEGIETEETAKLLQDLGVDYGQGYFFSRPVSAEAFAKLLDQYNQN